MKDIKKTKEQLIEEVGHLRTIISDLGKDKEKFQHIAENTSDSIAITSFDLKAKYLYVSPSVKNSLGYEPSDLVGKSFFSFIHPDDKKALFSLVKKSLKSIFTKVLHIDDPDLGETIEYRFKDKTGNWHYLQSTINFIGKNLLAITRDISEQKKVEIELKISEARFKSLYESLGDAVYVTKMGGKDIGKILEVNPAAIKQTGYSRKELLAMNILDDLYIAGTADINPADWEVIINKGELITVTEKKRRKDGSEFWTEVIVTPIEYNGSKAAISINHDITKRKLSENKLRESEEKYRNLVEKAKIGIGIDDLKGNLIYFNKQFAKLFGYTEDEMSVMSHKSLVHPDDYKYVAEIHKKRLQSKESPSRYEFKGVRKDGSVIFIEIDICEIIKKEGTILGTMSYLWDVTDRKKTEIELQKSEQDYRGLFENSHDAIIIFTPEDETILDINECACKLYGYNRDEFIGMSLKDISNNISVGEKKIKQTLKEGFINQFETIQYKKDGSSIFFEINASVIQYKGKQVILSSNRDISKRRLAEKALLESEEYFRTLIENSSDVVTIIDANGLITYESPSHQKVLGYKIGELIGNNVFKLVHDEDRERISLQFQKLLKNSGGTEDVNFRYLHKNGEWRYLEGTGKNLIHSPNINGVVVNYRDVSKRKRAMLVQSVMHKISFASNVTQNLDEFIGIIRKELAVLIDTTNFFVAIYEEETDTILLPYIADQKDTHTSFPAGKSYTARVIKSKESLFITKKELDKYNKNKEIEAIGNVSKIWLGVPMIINGNVTGAIVVQSYEDENAYDYKDMEILEFVSHTIGVSIERKRVEQNLKQALEKATESDRLKSAFLATMSHELRTPLNAIIGFSDIISDEVPIEDIVNFNKIISSSGYHLLSIVEDLFDITLIETGQTRIKIDSVNVYSVLNDVQEIVNIEQLNSKKDHLEIKRKSYSETDELIIHTDSSKLKQVLINLLKNALKFTHEGFVSYGFDIEIINKKSMLKFYVEDTGIGIPEEERELIFDVFRQVEDPNTRLYGGTGIGLSISKKITELLGGKIWLESEEGKGTVFYFTIPLKGTADSEKLLIEEVENEFEIKQNSIEKKTILIVEDVDGSIELLKILIGGMGYKTLEARNGQEAVNQCKENSCIDLVLMDVNMPIMNGYEATREIKKFRSKLPIISQTAYATMGDKEKSLDAGCDDYISKPVKKDQLLDLINKHLKN